jgi:hypothetical protein
VSHGDFLRGVSKRQPSLSHHLDEISQAELVAQLPTHTKNDHVTVKVTAGEQPVQTLQLAHCGPSNRSGRHSNRFVDCYMHHSRNGVLSHARRAARAFSRCSLHRRGSLGCSRGIRLPVCVEDWECRAARSSRSRTDKLREMPRAVSPLQPHRSAPSERRYGFGPGLALRNAISDFGSTYLGMALPPKLVYAPIYVKTPDATGTPRNA